MRAKINDRPRQNPAYRPASPFRSRTLATADVPSRVPVNDDSVSMRLTVPMMPFGRVTCDVVRPVFMAQALYQGNVKLT